MYTQKIIYTIKLPCECNRPKYNVPEFKNIINIKQKADIDLRLLFNNFILLSLN